MTASVKRNFQVLSVVLVILLGGAWFAWRAKGPDPKVIASAETRMWQAYYASDPLRLHLELTTLLEAQFHLLPADASLVAQSLAMAAWKFESSQENQEALVLPDLEAAFSSLRQMTKRSFDPKRAAKAELAWWVARRTPGQDSAQQVGQRIGEVYAILYGADRQGFLEAGILRAEAGRLRDQGGASCDWQQVESLLQQSYRTLVRAI